jgi:ubiquinone/menaquinone biosynthesis C-methylase UbiE
MSSQKTLFKYKCSCGNTDFLEINAAAAHCDSCDSACPISSTGVILLNQKKTEQNAYFDNLYRAGHSHAKDKFQEDYAGAFNKSEERAQDYLNSLGLDMERPIEHFSILDVACGSGWVTAGLIQNKNIRDCKFHAFDISPEGPEMLTRFKNNLESSNQLETSTQDAEMMKFGDDTFNIIIGSSVLHHFDHFEGFLADCHRMLKPGGVAVFGEPFAIGYGFGAAALLIAQKQLGTKHEIINAFYDDLVFRNKNPRELLKKLIDKHLFFQSTFIPLAQQIGFSSVNYILPGSREYYRDHFVDDLLKERGISDVHLAEYANSIYRVFFDMFDSDDFAHSMCAFVHIVLRKKENGWNGFYKVMNHFFKKLF